MSQVNQRNAVLDQFRVLAALAVVSVHVSGIWVMRDPDIHSWMWWVGNFAASFSRWCVPVFVMISGALLLKAPAPSTIGEFYVKRALRLLPCTAFWSIFYLGFQAYTSRKIDPQLIFENMLHGKPFYHLWYLYMLLGLVLFTPFLKIMVESASKSMLQVALIGCFVISSVEALFGVGDSTFLSKFLSYIGYFLLGYYFDKYPRSHGRFGLVISLLLAGLLVAVLTGALLPMMGPKAWALMYDFLNPFVIMMSISIYLLVIEHVGIYSPLLKIAPLTLGIYVIHPTWIWLLNWVHFDRNLSDPLVGIPVIVLTVFLLSTLSAAVFIRIPYLKRTIS
jgi:surface polysaccharide O-acyltransferase-like enzyme